MIADKAELWPNLEYDAAVATMMIATVIPPSVIPMTALPAALAPMTVITIAIAPIGSAIVVRISARSLLLHQNNVGSCR
ncbi:hypothetical protein ACXHMN_07650 [Rhizobium sp. LEGMi12c]